MRPLIRATWLGMVLTAVGLAWAADTQPIANHPVQHTFSVLDYGATGDGTTLDTAAINQAIAACAKAGGGQVFFPPGRYLCGTVRLTNCLTLFLAAGATLVGTTNLEQLTLEDVRFSLAKDDLRPVAMADGVQRLNLDNFRFTHLPGVTEPLVTTNVGKLNLWQTDLTSPR